MPLILGIVASGNYPRVTNSYESIATVTVGSGGSASIAFTSIPSTYKHLQIRALSRTNRADTNDFLTLRFNSDSGSNYAYHSLYGNGSTANANDTGTSTGTPWSAVTAGNSAGASMFGAQIWDVLDYQNTNKYKTVRALTGTDQNGTTGRIYFMSNLWQSTSAVNAITITSTYGTALQEYSKFALYGIKG
jgi:hypothetical protein